MLPVIEVSHLYKCFKLGTQDVEILKDVSFNIYENEFKVIFGPSGSGKSTILHSILGLEPPTKGTVRIMGIDLFGLGASDEVSDFRRTHMGMIYQQPNWIKALSVIENVAFPLALLGVPMQSALRSAWEQLMRIKLDEWVSYYPTQLSSGQQQKAALARALVTNPKIIVADEPTGNLDNASGHELMEILRSLSENENKTIVMVTHDLEYLKYANSAIQILDGKVQSEYVGEKMEELTRAAPSRKTPEGKN